MRAARSKQRVRGWSWLAADLFRKTPLEKFIRKSLAQVARLRAIIWRDV
jgi:hypothetical protein